MKWLFKWAFRLALLAAILLVALFLSKNAVVKGVLEHQIRARTGLEARLGQVSVGVFAPVLDIEGLRIYNAAEFGGALLLDAPEVHVEYDRQALAARRLRLKLVRLQIAELNVVRNATGRTNLLHLDWKPAVRALKQASLVPFPEIEVLNVSLRRVRLLDLDNPRRSREFQPRFENLIFRNIRSVDEMRGVLFLIWLRSGGEATGTENASKPAP